MDIGGGQNDEDQQDINISDVFEAISLADPSYVGGVVDAMSRQGPTGPYVRIVEQPASRALRFRYPCEGRSAGSLPGVNSTNERKTYPTIEIRNFVGKAVVFVSCVTKDEPYKPHPHKLVGREYISRGVSTQKVEVTPDCCQFSFTNLGIQCVKRKDVEASLADRESLKVDPFKTGYAHRQQPNSIDLNAIRLCFQVFLHNEATGEHRTSLRPVVSNVIYDKKAMGDLHILRVSHYSGPATGGTEVILLCEKVNREGTEVIFTERDASGAVVWEERATIVATHKQCALVFETPPYRRTDTRTDVPVNFRLVRKSDDTCSNEMQFLYTPNREVNGINYKKRKTLLPCFESESEQLPIKLEPRDPRVPHAFSQYAHEAAQAQWNYGGGGWASGAGGAGGAGYATPYQQAISPHAMSPNMQQALSPNMQQMSPVMQQAMSPSMQPVSPNMHAMQAMPGNLQAMSPMGHAMGHASPMGQGGLSPMGPMAHGNMSPNMHVQQNMGHVSPNMGHVSPNMGHVSPNVGHISPNLVQQQNYPQQPAADNMSTPSITGLLEGDVSGELSLTGLSSLLAGRPDQLSDSLIRLSTAELLPDEHM